MYKWILSSVFIGVVATIALHTKVKAQELDPTKPLGFSQAAAHGKSKHKLTLQSIVVGKKGSLAVINGKVLKEGQYIRGFRVKQIAKDFVLLSSTEKQVKLPLFSKAVTKAFNKN